MLHKAIKDFEDYLISDDGRVYSLKSQRYLTPELSATGYYKVILYNKGKRKVFRIHRLVAQAFIPNTNNKPEVDHINRNKLNNRVENLRWCTSSENKKNRDLTNFTISHRKLRGRPLVEKINDEVSIGYLSVRSVPNIKRSTLQNHISNNETYFTAKNREFYTSSKSE